MDGEHALPPPDPRTLEHVAGWLRLKITSGAYSGVFLADVARHLERRTENIFAILDEIGALEGAAHSRASRTKAEEQFKHPPLKGLWHKHHQQMSVGSLAANLRNHCGRGRMEKLIRERLFTEAEVTEEVAGSFAHDFVHGGYMERRTASKLTGEWIVFARHEGANYYLTLGAHGGDEAIAARVRACASEFPHLPGLRI